MKRSAPAALSVAALLASGLLVACSEQRAPVQAASQEQAAEPTATIQLPDGQVVVTVDDAREIEESDVADGQEDADGHWVQIGWEFTPGAGIPTNVSGFMITDGTAPATVEATIDGRTFPLGEVGNAEAESFYPADEGTAARDVSIAVEFDGVTQTIDGDGGDLQAGAASGLYDIDDSQVGAIACDLMTSPSQATVITDCSTGSVRLPWVTTHGWAPDDSDWLIAAANLRVDEVRLGGRVAEVDGQQHQASMDGVEPTDHLLERSAGLTALDTQDLFAVAADDPAQVEVRRALHTRPSLDADVVVTITIDSAP